MKNHPIRFSLRIFLEPGYALKAALKLPKDRTGRDLWIFNASMFELYKAYGYACAIAEIYKAL